MDPERALTVALMGFFAGSATLFVLMTIVGALTDDLGWVRFAGPAAVAVVVGVATGLTVHRRSTDEQLTGR